MTVLLYGDTLYFSSSVKKKPAASWLRLFPNVIREEKVPLVRDVLMNCGLEDGGDTHHRMKANCGEMLAIHQWTIDNPDKKLAELKDCWIVAVNDVRGDVCVKQPCSPDGCNRAHRAFVLELLVQKELAESWLKHDY